MADRLRDDDDDAPYFVIETRGGDSVGAFLLGALVGAAAALLLAPRSGAETQAQIAEAARRLRDGVGDRVDDVRGGVTRRVDAVRGAVDARVGQVRAAAETGFRAATDAREELQRRVDEAKRTYRSGVASLRGGDGEGVVDGGGKAEVVVLETTVETEGSDLETRA
ncbi:MAG TPA: YtxH domain-containing protein [Longimicrobium sp.]|nr:YtxH domain-containing protein [Longimicrobium sp.]